MRVGAAKLIGEDRIWAYFQSRLAYTMAMFNLLIQLDGIQVDDDGSVQPIKLPPKVIRLTPISEVLTTATG